MVKNLLLVPPPLELRSKVEERKRQRRAAGCIDSEKVHQFDKECLTVTEFRSAFLLLNSVEMMVFRVLLSVLAKRTR